MTTWNQGIYRHNNLVYHRSNKCAGTFFADFFSKHGWKSLQHQHELKTSNVNFGILIDPITRRAKAITERIFMAGMQEYIDDKCFQRFIEDICIIDEHLIPYSYQFKQIANLTLFRLEPGISQKLKEFCADHGSNISLFDETDDKIRKNASNRKKLTVYAKVVKCLKTPLYNDLFKDDIYMFENLKLL